MPDISQASSSRRASVWHLFISTLNSIRMRDVAVPIMANLDGVSVAANPWVFWGDEVVRHNFSVEAEDIDLGKHKALFW